MHSLAIHVLANDTLETVCGLQAPVAKGVEISCIDLQVSWQASFMYFLF